MKNPFKRKAKTTTINNIDVQPSYVFETLFRRVADTLEQMSRDTSKPTVSKPPRPRGIVLSTISGNVVVNTDSIVAVDRRDGTTTVTLHSNYQQLHTLLSDDVEYANQIVRYVFGDKGYFGFDNKTLDRLTTNNTAFED